MKIIIDKNTKEVIYAVNDSIVVTLGDEAVIGVISDGNINSTNSELIENIPNPPDTFLGRAYTYDTEWHIIDQEVIDAFKLINRPPVPQSITPLQAKLQLLEMELLDEVEAMVATDRKISLYWNEALEIRRDHATLLAMVGALGLTDAQVDEMFIEASKLS